MIRLAVGMICMCSLVFLSMCATSEMIFSEVKKRRRTFDSGRTHFVLSTAVAFGFAVFMVDVAEWSLGYSMDSLFARILVYVLVTGAVYLSAVLYGFWRIKTNKTRLHTVVE